MAREAFSRGDATELAFTGHTLRGMAGSLCASAVMEAARRLEHAGRDGKLEAAEPALEALGRALEELRAPMEKLAEEGSLE